jgi:UBX domain-containing protein 1/4
LYRIWIKSKKIWKSRKPWRTPNSVVEVDFWSILSNFLLSDRLAVNCADKIEDARAKAAVKAQIEIDKRERAEKFAREKALREGRAVPESSTPAPAAASASTTPASGVAGKDFKETRLQIRMASGGQAYTTTLSSDASTCPFFLAEIGSMNIVCPLGLREVAEYLAGQTLTVDVETVTLTQHFPRQVYCSL